MLVNNNYYQQSFADYPTLFGSNQKYFSDMDGISLVNGAFMPLEYKTGKASLTLPQKKMLAYICSITGGIALLIRQLDSTHYNLTSIDYSKPTLVNPYEVTRFNSVNTSCLQNEIGELRAKLQRTSKGVWVSDTELKEYYV